MPEEGPPRAPLPGRPSGPPLFTWFDGILEGPCGDLLAMQRVLDRLESSCGVDAQLDEDGARFTVILDDATIPGDRMPDSGLESITRHLQNLLDLLPAGGAVESTLRCTEIHEKEAIEVLFAPLGREMRCVGRVRPLVPQDMDRAPRQTASIPDLNISRRKGLLLAALFLMAFAVLAWQGGWVDTVLSASPDTIEVRLGPFDRLLLLSLDREWGSYVVTISRGSRYPLTTEAVNRLQAGALTNAERAAVNAVCDGDQVYVRLEDADGRVLESARVELRPLVSREKAKIKLSLPGRINAAVIQVALDPGQEKK